MSHRIGIAVVCRMHSKRLPDKALLPLGGSTIIDKCIHNCLTNKHYLPVLLATSNNSADDQLVRQVYPKWNIGVFRGHEYDVARRLYDLAVEWRLDSVMRVTGDSPFISYELIEELSEMHSMINSDYTFFENACLGTRPEIFSVPALKRVLEMFDTSKSEYLTLYFKNNPEIFQSLAVTCPVELQGDYRLNVDYPEDYQLACEVYKHLRDNVDSHPIPLKTVLNIVRQYQLYKLNAECKPIYNSKDVAEFTRPLNGNRT